MLEKITEGLHFPTSIVFDADYHTNMALIVPDGKLYFAQGAAANVELATGHVTARAGTSAWRASLGEL